MEPYRASDTQIPEVALHFSKEDLEEKRKTEPHLTAEQFEYIWVGCLFYSKLIELQKGFPLHASAVALNQQAYLFSAPSGTGSPPIRSSGSMNMEARGLLSSTMTSLRWYMIRACGRFTGRLLAEKQI